jgi:hypothetical protein
VGDSGLLWRLRDVRDLSFFCVPALSSLLQFLLHGPRWLLELLPSNLHFSRKGRRESERMPTSLRVDSRLIYHMVKDRAGGVAQVVKCLPSKCEALSSAKNIWSRTSDLPTCYL